EFALRTREPFGVWGGLAESERRAILERTAPAAETSERAEAS
nr:WhiB family transcriptional regulator [Pseudonocardiales bacterium]